MAQLKHISIAYLELMDAETDVFVVKIILSEVAEIAIHLVMF